ncbi:MAG: TRAP transporter large permease subunit, partial [Candidatus Competibacterales bacterium]|nr:TRAP transporter large permease subunit [Candidatus Competibacterales bacterium]
MYLEQIFVILMFATFGLLLLTGFPVAWVLAGTAVIWAVIGHIAVTDFNADIWYDWSSAIALLPERFWPLVSSDTLVALPMFIFMGIMLDRSGVAERLMSNMVKLFGGVRGGYAVTVIVIGMLLAATTGIIGASVVLLGMLSIPIMMKTGYSRSLAVGTACATGTLGILIPPSIMLVIMADRLARPETSVGDLFLGALFPGLL